MAVEFKRQVRIKHGQVQCGFNDQSIVFAVLQIALSGDMFARTGPRKP